MLILSLFDNIIAHACLFGFNNLVYQSRKPELRLFILPLICAFIESMEHFACSSVHLNGISGMYLLTELSVCNCKVGCGVFPVFVLNLWVWHPSQPTPAWRAFELGHYDSVAGCCAFQRRPPVGVCLKNQGSLLLFT